MWALESSLGAVSVLFLNSAGYMGASSLWRLTNSYAFLRGRESTQKTSIKVDLKVKYLPGWFWCRTGMGVSGLYLIQTTFKSQKWQMWFFFIIDDRIIGPTWWASGRVTSQSCRRMGLDNTYRATSLNLPCYRWGNWELSEGENCHARPREELAK